MTVQTNSRKCLGGSPTGLSFSRLCALTLAATLLAGGAATGFGQEQSQPDAAKPVVEKKPAKAPGEMIWHSYRVHQATELGGRITSVSGSQAMWKTLVNQSSGMRFLGLSLELRSADTHKTPIFDTLSAFGTGFGGDPYDVARMRISKGRWYEFAGSFRRDRNFFDYNQFVNSLLTTYTATTPVLVSEPHSLHLFNAVRRNTDTSLTLLPLYVVSFRAGLNHITHEGPRLTTVHNAGDVQVAEWYRTAADTYTGGVDWKPIKRTVLSYDQFYVYYKGDSSYQLTGANYTLNTTTTPVSLGVDVLGGATVCGSTSTVLANGTKLTAATEPLEVSNGIVSQYCVGTITQSQTTPTRTSFPTEQLRFISHYWERVTFNGRLLYSSGASTIHNFNETFNGLGRGNVRQTIETGGGVNGLFANNKRINTSGDFGVEADLAKYLSVSEAFSSWDTRTWGATNNTTQTWTGNSGAVGPPIVPTTTMLTPLTDPSVILTNVTTTANSFLNQKIAQNTLLGTVAVTSQFKLTSGWRFKSREISDPHATNLTWHENWALVGAVIQPSKAVRVTANYDAMKSTYASGSAVDGEPATPAALLPSNTFTRAAPDHSYHIKMRATVAPARWIDLAATANVYSAKNDDPMVNMLSQNHDISLAASVHPTEQFSAEINYAYDVTHSSINYCYIFTANPNAPLPPGAANAGTCTVANSPNGGAAGLYLSYGWYNAPSNFISGSFNYAPIKTLRFNGGVRLNDVNGSADILNPLAVPGALHSRYLMPYTDAEYKIAPQWAWHGNWAYDGYGEQGPQGTLPSRNTHGNIVTLGVKYAF